MLLPLTIYAVYALSFTMSKTILSYLPPILYVGSRITCAGMLLLCYTIYTRGETTVLSYIQNSWKTFIKLTLVLTYLPFTLSFIALQNVTTVEASLIYNISPCVSAIFSYFLFNKKLDWLKISGLAVSMGALVPLFYNRIINTYAGALESADSLLFLIIAVTSTTYGWLLFSRLYNQYGYDALIISSFSSLIGGTCMLATSYVMESWQFQVDTSIYTVIGLFAALMLAIDIIYTNMYGLLLGQYTATFMALLGITLPLFTSLFSWLFLQENIPRGFFPACALMAVGLYMFYKGEEKPA